jgi:ribose 5-phosphate isomerase B
VKIAVGCDHAAFEHKKFIAKELAGEGHEILDMGTDSTAPCDYPDVAKAVARSVASGIAERGVLMCGTGLGMCMTANKIRGIRAAACHDEYTTIMSRSHNDANVLCMGGRVLDAQKALQLIHIWLRTPFEGGRHGGRVSKIMAIEEEECDGRKKTQR